MKVLALETSSTTGGAAVVVDGQVIACETSSHQRSHGELISVFVANCLQRAGLALSDLDVIAVGRGPGSFTGLRVAASAAKTYAFMTGKPLVSIDSLTLLAHASRPGTRGQEPILSILNAHKNLLYAALFRLTEKGDLAPLKPPQVASVNEIEAWVTGSVLVVGDGFAAYEGAWSTEFTSRALRRDELSDFPSPAVLGQLASTEVRSGRVVDWNMYTPLYLRASEAEEKQRGLFLKPQALKDEVHGKSRRS